MRKLLLMVAFVGSSLVAFSSSGLADHANCLIACTSQERSCEITCGGTGPCVSRCKAQQYTCGRGC
jgi:hypothetical protein